MNYFAHPSAAERYAQSRPYFHPLVIDRVRTFLKLDEPVPVNPAFFVLHLESTVFSGADPAMLAHAPVHPAIRYLEAPAEQLPLECHSVDLITVSLAFHWLDRSRFLAEAWRLLRPTGTLVIYTNHFLCQMSDNPEFARAWRESKIYPDRYPPPPRNDQPFTDENALAAHFMFVQREPYTNEIQFSPESLALYMTTHSNVIAAVEQGGESFADAYSWLLKSVSPFFAAPIAHFVFAGEIWYLQPLLHDDASAC